LMQNTYWLSSNIMKSSRHGLLFVQMPFSPETS
jgi:hypothetical protein